MSIKLKVDERFWGNYDNDYRVVEATGNTVGECLNHLVKQQPTIKKEIFKQDGNLTLITFIFINRKGIFGKKLAKPVKDGDEIMLISSRGRSCCH